MLTTRQEKILKMIVEYYVSYVEPVSSNYICNQINVSSATIRNDMVVLENEGYIEKTHVASGRVPTEQGYKYYVSDLIDKQAIKLSQNESTKIARLFSYGNLTFKDAISESVKLISELTNYSVVVLGGYSKEEKLREVRVLPIDNHSVVAIIVTNAGKVFNQTFMVDEEINVNELKDAVKTINELLVNTPLSEVSNKLNDEIKPILRQFIKQYEALCEAFIETLRNLNAADDIKQEGQDKLLIQPEFDDIELVRRYLKKINDDDAIKLIEYSDDIDVKIGADNKFLEDLSLVTTKYESGDEDTKVAIIGPKRMDYSHVVALLNEIKVNLERLNKEKDNE